MNIKIVNMIDKINTKIDVAVIIDVFRAFSVETYIINNNVKKLIPVGDINIAYKLKEQNKNSILIGERGGKPLPDFDYGNSPSKLKDIDFTGKEVIHTTSCGTQGIEKVKNAKEIITGSLVNAKAIVKYIEKKKEENIFLVCTGYKTESLYDEDYLCAYYIKSMLEGKNIDLSSYIENLKQSGGAKFFDKEKQDIFPEEDFYLCTKLNKFNFVLKVKQDENKINYIEKIIVN